MLGTGTAEDDNAYQGMPIGFTFTFRGVAYTTFSAEDNGYMMMGSTLYDSYTAISNASTGAGYNDVICPMNNDLQGQTNAELRYQTLGVAPNRTCVIQYLHFGQFSTGMFLDLNIRL